jgi:hypothetical protein
MKFVMKSNKMTQFLEHVNNICLNHGVNSPNQVDISHENDMSTVEYNGVFITRLTPEQLAEIQSLTQTF